MTMRDVAVSLRLATPDDVDAIADVHTRSRLAAYEAHVSPAFLHRRSEAERRADWVRLLDHRSTAVTWVAERDGRVVGFCCATTEGTPTDAPHIDALYVLARAHGSGIGRALLTTTGRTLAGRGFAHATLNVFAFNAPAIGFYERLGWVREATWPIADSGEPPVVVHRYGRDLAPIPPAAGPAIS